MSITLMDSNTNDEIRPAHLDEWRASVEAAALDGGAGIIDVNGRACWVAGDPDGLTDREGARIALFAAGLHELDVADALDTSERLVWDGPAIAAAREKARGSEMRTRRTPAITQATAATESDPRADLEPPMSEDLELRRAARAAEMRMHSAEHWLCLQADAWLQRPTEYTASEMRKARDEWRAREAVWHAAHHAAYEQK